MDAHRKISHLSAWGRMLIKNIVSKIKDWKLSSKCEKLFLLNTHAIPIVNLVYKSAILSKIFLPKLLFKIASSTQLKLSREDIWNVIHRSEISGLINNLQISGLINNLQISGLINNLQISGLINNRLII